VRNGYERDGPWRYRLVLGRGRFQRLKFAPLGAVQDIPAAGTQLLADGIGRLEVTIAPALDAFSQKLFSL
jgi:hypothetical protein